MKIGDEVFVHGYVDEIRKDVIIIRNDGGYFGTVPSEMFYYEEDERGYGTMNTADTPQTERDAYWKELFEAVVKGEMSDASANQAWYEYINKQDTPQTDLPTEEFVEGMKNLRMEVKQTDCGVDGSEVRMLCKDCEYFKIEYQPIKGFDFGRARCTKYDLITDFRDKRKFKWLSCEDRPKKSEVE